jgi:DNA-binding HxlR family transcriptional regulator
VYDTAPPQVSYELTELGRSLATTLAQLAAWSIDNLAGIEENRRRYDGQRSLR